MFRTLFLVLGLAVSISACGKASIGESCDKSGDTSQCEDGAICAAQTAGTVCRKICAEDPDCAAFPGTSCKGTSGSSQKSCQP